MSNYTTYRRSALKRVRVRWLVGCFLLACLSAAIAFRSLPDDVWRLLANATQRGDRAATVAQKVGVADLAPLIYLAGVLGALGTLAWKARVKVASFVYDRFLDRFHDELFLPITRPRPSQTGSTPLPWIAPSADQGSGARLALWTGLQEWARRGADLATTDSLPFSWALLVGRPGAGKSRTADEFARSLGRREVLGDQFQSTSTRAARRAARRLWAGAALRRARRRPASTDPWDAGRPAHRHASQAALLQNAVGYREWLKTWRPRAPTLIVFEDPRAEEAAFLINWLGEKAASIRNDLTENVYEFPVRLLIVNQTIPSDLQLVAHPPGSGQWASQLGPVMGGFWIVDESQYLSWADWMAIKHQRFEAEDARAWVERKEFERITRGGHPLLVESLVHWLEATTGNKPPMLEDVTPAALLKDRAHRIRQALETAHLREHSQWCALAASTVVGGLPRSAAPNLRGQDLQRLFPEAAAQAGERIPPIRPDLIGFAFADLVIETAPEPGLLYSATDATQTLTAGLLASIAWRADPFAVLGALHRLADPVVQRDFGPPSVTRRRLIEALEAVPETALGIDPEAIARAFARYHLAQGRSLEAVRRHFTRLSPAAARHFAVHDVLEALARPEVATRDLLAVFSLALARGLDEVDLGAEELEKLLEATAQLAQRVKPRGVIAVFPGQIPTEGFERLGQRIGERLQTLPKAWGQLERSSDLLEVLWGSQAIKRTVLLRFAVGLSRGDGSSIGLDTPKSRAAAVVVALEASYEHIQGFVESLRTVGTAVTGVEGARALGLAWVRAAYGHSELAQAEPAEACAREIARIAAPFELLPLAERRELTERLAAAWAHAAFAHGLLRQPEPAEACAREIDRIVAPFDFLPLPERHELAEQSAAAWNHAAYAHGLLGQAEPADACAREVARIAALHDPLPLADRRELAERLAAALGSAAYAHGLSKQPQLAEACAREIARIAVPFDVLPLAERRELAQRLTAAWANAAYAHGLLKQAEEAEACAHEIARTVAPFDASSLAERRILAESLAAAWAHAADAHGSLNKPEQVQACAREIARIAAPFEILSLIERREVNERLAGAWDNAAYAHGQLQQPEPAKACAREIRRIALPFEILPLAEKRVLNEWLAAAWAHAAYAHGQLGQPQPAEACAREIELVHAHFQLLPIAERRELAEWLAGAWSHAAYAHGVLLQAEAAEACAREIARIAAPFATLPLLERRKIVELLTETWRYAGKAYERSGLDADAHRCFAEATRARR